MKGPSTDHPSDDAAHSPADQLSLDFELQHPTEKVWHALTDPALLSEWLLPVANFRLDPGAEFTFKAPPQPGWDGVVNCQCREIEAKRMLSWSWVVGDIDTVVTFTLTPTSGGMGTRLSIVQSGFKPKQKHALGGARYGWKMMSGQLAELLVKVP